LLVVLAFAAVGAVVVARHWKAGYSERQAIATMPTTERSALYVQVLRTTEMICARAHDDDGLAERCRGSASFLLTFPECDDACRSLARAHQRGPTR
jgi:hypothetical protein